MLPGYKELYERNPDTIGWLKILNSVVDYPVMQTPNAKDYYLQRDFNKEDSKRGCLYVREECDVFAPSDNVTIYGHTMADGSMFACLNAYTNKKAWDNNSLIFFDTLTEYHTYKIFAVFKTSANIGQGFAYHQFVDAATEEEFNELCEFLKETRFERLGCFAYSAEEGTVAADMPDQVPEKIKNRRRDIVMRSQERVADEYNQSQIGKTVTVLVEAYDRYGECWFGRTAGDAPDIDTKVFFTTATRVAPGDMVQVRITDCMDWDLLGERV
jgi:hypothetical protein